VANVKVVLVWAAIAGIAVRLMFGLSYWVDKPLTRDEREYLSLARNLAAGRGFTYDAAIRDSPIEPFGRAPGYPFWLALTGAASDANTVPASVKIVQSLLGGVAIVLMGIIAGRIAGAGAAKAAAVLAALYPPLVWISAYALSEALLWPLALCGAWLFDQSLSQRGRRALWLAAAAGLVLGAAVLVRPATSIALLLGGAWLIWRRRPALLAAAALGAALVIGPWSVRNIDHYGRFVLVATEGGVTFWTGNNALAMGEGDLAANPGMKAAKQSLMAAHPGLTEESMEPVYYREAFRWMASHPFDWILLEARKVFFLIVPVGPSYLVHSALYFWTSVLSYGLVLPFAAAGLWRGRARLNRAAGFFMLAASAVVVCLVFFPQERFRIPLIDSALVLGAALAVGARREDVS